MSFTRLLLALFGDALIRLIHKFVYFLGRHGLFTHLAKLRLHKVEILAFGKVVFELLNREGRGGAINACDNLLSKCEKLLLVAKSRRVNIAPLCSRASAPPLQISSMSAGLSRKYPAKKKS